MISVTRFVPLKQATPQVVITCDGIDEFESLLKKLDGFELDVDRLNFSVSLVSLLRKEKDHVCSGYYCPKCGEYI